MSSVQTAAQGTEANGDDRGDAITRDDRDGARRDEPASRRFWSAMSDGVADADLPLSTAFDIVKNRRRRQVLAYVLEEGGPTTVSDLAEHIAAIENDKPESLLTSQERKRVYIGLYQCHLPRMDDAGVIAFDRHRGDVEARPEATLLAPYVHEDGGVATPGHSPGRLQQLSLVGAALFGLASLLPGVPPAVGQVVLLGLLAAVGGLALALEGSPRERGSGPGHLSPWPDSQR